MTMVIIELPIEDGAVDLDGEAIVVNLGNGVKLRTSLPDWVTTIGKFRLRLEFETEGRPDRDELGKPSV